MIKGEVIEQASELYSGTLYGGKVIGPIPNSPLASLVSTLSSFNECGSNEEIEFQSLVPGTANGDHTEVENQYAGKIASVINNIIDIAKNVVTPHAINIIDLIEKNKKDKLLNSHGLLGNIKQIDLPPLLTDDLLLELMSPYKSTPASIIIGSQPILTRIREDFTDEELLELIKTGSSATDKKILGFIKYIDFISDDLYGHIDTSLIPVYDAVLYFLLLTGIENEKNDKATALMEDNNTKLIIAKIRAACAGRALREIDTFNYNIKNNQLVSKVDFMKDKRESNYENDFLVYGKVYRDWIVNKGGSPEAALGYFSSLSKNGSSVNVQGLYTDPTYYYQIYERKLSLIKSKDILEDITNIKRTVETYLTNYIINLEDVDRPALHEKLAKAMDTEFYGDASLEEYVIKVVSRTLTIGHDVKNILLEKHSILQSDPNATVEYALFIATIRLVSRFLANQIQLKTISK